MNTAIKPITPEREQELVAKLVDFLSSRYDAGNLYDILRHGKPRAGIIETAHDRRRVVIPPTTQKHQKSMEHSDMEALGFQLRDYYEEVE